METKGKAIPLSREDRDAKKVKIDAEEFNAHIEVLHTELKEMIDLKKIKK